MKEACRGCCFAELHTSDQVADADDVVCQLGSRKSSTGHSHIGLFKEPRLVLSALHPGEMVLCIVWVHITTAEWWHLASGIAMQATTTHLG